MGFFNKIEGPIKKQLNKLFADERLRTLITYREYAGQTKSGNRRVASFTDHSIYAIRLQHSEDSVSTAFGKMEVGDQLYLLKFEDVGTWEHTLKNEITDENGTFRS